MISQECLKTDVQLLLSANRKSYNPRRLTKQQMTLSDLEWPFNVSRAIFVVAELLVIFITVIIIIILTRDEAPVTIKSVNCLLGES